MIAMESENHSQHGSQTHASRFGESPKNLVGAFAIAVAATTLLIYWPVGAFDFVNFDDPVYIYANPHVITGLTIENVRWAFTTLHGDASYWHPLTWLSHQLDCQLFGRNPGPHHLTSVMIHLLNSSLLVLLFYRLTKNLPIGCLIAFCFALHPLHVESVAWLSERKDLLCGLFWIITLLAYLSYVENYTLRRYFIVLGSFICALMSKPMAVTLPFVLLLLDYWPLKRLKENGEYGQLSGPHSNVEPKPIGFLLREKVPLFFLSAVSSIVTLLGQTEVNAVASVDEVPLGHRIGNALAWIPMSA